MPKKANSPDAPHFRPLGDSYDAYGRTYDIEKRIGDVALAADREGGGFEVFIVLRNPGGVIGKSVIAPAEAVPAASKWGIKGWTYLPTQREESEAKFESLCVERGLIECQPVRRRFA